MNEKIKDNRNVINIDEANQIENTNKISYDKYDSDTNTKERQNDRNLNNKPLLNESSLNFGIKIRNKRIKKILIIIILGIFIILNIVSTGYLMLKSSDANNRVNNIEKKIENIENNTENEFKSVKKKINLYDIEFKDIENQLNQFKDFDNALYLLNDKIININDFLEIQFSLQNEKYHIFKSLINEGIMEIFNKKIKKYNISFFSQRDSFYKNDFYEKFDGKNFTIFLY